MGESIGEHLVALTKTGHLAFGGVLATTSIPVGAAVGAGIGGAANLAANRRSSDRVDAPSTRGGRSSQKPCSHHYIAEGAAIGSATTALAAGGYAAHRYRKNVESLNSVSADLQKTINDGIARTMRETGAQVRTQAGEFARGLRESVTRSPQLERLRTSVPELGSALADAAEAVRDALPELSSRLRRAVGTAASVLADAVPTMEHLRGELRRVVDEVEFTPEARAHVSNAVTALTARLEHFAETHLRPEPV